MQNLHLMIKEVYKSLNHIGPRIGWDAFEKIDIIKAAAPINPGENAKLELRCGSRVKLPFPKNTVCLNTFDFRAGSAWNHLPKQIKSLKTLKEFVFEVERVKLYCSCKLCTVF